MYCNCMRVLQGKAALAPLWDEMKEFVEEPSMDEFSDIMWGIGRLIAGLFGKVYIKMPFDGLHREKVDARMVEFGCVRSKRHLVNGECPNK